MSLFSTRTFALATTLSLVSACGTAGITALGAASNAASSTSGATASQSPTAPQGSPTAPAAGTIAAASGTAIGFEFLPGSASASAHAASDTAFWLASAKHLSSEVVGSTPAARLIVGNYTVSTGSVTLAFPASASSTLSSSGSVSFGNKDTFGSLLTSFDGNGVQVVLESSVGFNKPAEMAGAMLAAYGSHKSVVGVSFDLANYQGGEGLSDADAAALVAAVSALKSGLSVELRTTDASLLPSAGISGLTYVLDTKGKTSVAEITDAMQSFASTYQSSPVKFIVGAAGQRAAVCASTAPETALLGPAMAAGSNVKGAYWSSATVQELSPGTGFSCAQATSTTAPAAATGTATTTGATNTGGSASSTGTASGTGSTTASSTTTGAGTTTGTATSPSTTSGATPIATGSTTSSTGAASSTPNSATGTTPSSASGTATSTPSTATGTGTAATGSATDAGATTGATSNNASTIKIQ